MYDPMNIYRGRYKEFIERLLGGNIENDISKYSENHHIICRCTFEDENDHLINAPDNQFRLSARNHFIAHKILAEDNPNIKELQYAYWRMCNNTAKSTPTEEEYEDARLRFSNSMKGNSYALGNSFNLSQESRYKISLSNKGNKSKTGQVDSEETRRKKSESLKMYERTPEHCEHLSESCRGKIVSLETRKKQSESITLALDRPEVKESLRNRKFHLICKSCGMDFIGKSSNQKYCEECMK